MPNLSLSLPPPKGFNDARWLMTITATKPHPATPSDVPSINLHRPRIDLPGHSIGDNMSII